MRPLLLWLDHGRYRGLPLVASIPFVVGETRH